MFHEKGMSEWISGCDLSTFTREKGAKIQVINELIHIIHAFLMWIGRETQKLSTQKICKKTINFTPNRKFFVTNGVGIRSLAQAKYICYTMIRYDKRTTYWGATTKQ